MILAADDPAPPDPAPELSTHQQAVLSAASWSLLAYATGTLPPGTTARGAAALGLSDGLAGRPCGTHIVDHLELEAYRMGHRAGSVVRTGNATP